jgi:hypothetical protein
MSSLFSRGSLVGGFSRGDSSCVESL